MKQSEWRERVDYIKAEMLNCGKEKSATEIFKQFSTRLSATILHFFAESESFSPYKNLTVDQKAFTHSLQLYDLQSVMRLVGNYDVSKGLKVVLPGIEKSYRSLMVIPRLERFIKNSLESTALGVYKFRLEDSLSRFLKCSREELYEEYILIEKMKIVSTTRKELREKFFTERLRTLFSSNYRTYLMLKNRYFLNLIFRHGNNQKNFLMEGSRQTNLPFTLGKNESTTIKKMEEKFDFRFVEQVVKDHIFRSDGKGNQRHASNFLNSRGRKISEIISDNKLELKNRSYATKNLIQKNNKYNLDSSNFFENEKLENNISAYLLLCTKYGKPLTEMMDSFCPVPECSSPYFRPRAEDYRVEYSNFFRELMGMNLQVITAIHNFTLELLVQRGKEYNAAERWGMVSLRKYDEKSIYFRKTEKGTNFLDRKTEWSILIQFRIPFDISLPMENGEKILIEKGKLCLFQIGTAFFDHGHKKKMMNIPMFFSN